MPVEKNHQLEVKLREALLKYFDVSELRTLCHDLNIEYELVNGTRSDWALEIVKYLKRRGKLEKLVTYIKASRPNQLLTKEVDELWQGSSRDLAENRVGNSKTNSGIFSVQRISLLGILFALIIAGTFLTLNILSGNASRNYIVRIYDQATGASIGRAKVTLEIMGAAPLNTFSDSDGFARIQIPKDYLSTPGRLLIEKNGYRSISREIDITVDTLPEQVYLTPDLTDE